MKSNLLDQPVIDEFRGDYWFLSNFYPSSIVLVMVFEWAQEIMTFPTAEHAFQAFKAQNLRDAKMIAESRTPADAKRLGATVKMRNDWPSVRVPVMTGVLVSKFTQNEKLKQRLLNTGDAQLIEGNTWGDKFWGVCDGEGKNHLGIALMNIREHFQTSLDKQSLPR